jgi:hypothetical protein
MTQRKERLYHLLDGDPYSYELRPGRFGYHGPCGLAYYALRLHTIPNDIVGYMHSRIPSLQPFDWWWLPRQAADQRWIEICIWEAKVLALMSSANLYLVRLPTPDEIYLGVPAETRDDAVASLFQRLRKAANEWRSTSRRVDGISEKMPEPVARELRDRWLTAIESWMTVRDALVQLGVTSEECRQYLDNPA